MTRRVARKKASTVQTKRVAWNDDFAQLFRLSGEDWSPPSEVRVREGVRTASFTADFKMANGHPCRLLVRIDLRSRTVIDETMSVAWKVRAR